jgi:hypothetical protein
MTQEINDGGPAFAYAEGPNTMPQLGMTLRDYFAGQALAGMLADPECDGNGASMAKSSYQLADAMITERCARAKSDSETA